MFAGAISSCASIGTAWSIHRWKRRSATSSQKRPHHAGKSRSRPARHRLLADQLRADRGARRRRLFPRPVPPHQSAAVKAGSTSILDGVAGRAASTSARIWRGGSTTPVGGAKAKSSSSSTATTSSPPSAAPARRIISAAPTTSMPARSTRRSRSLCRIHHALFGHAAGDPARRHLPIAAALRPVSLAHHGSDPLRDGSAGHDPGARLAHRGETGATCRCRTISPRSPIGTRQYRPRPWRRCPIGTIWR